MKETKELSEIQTQVLQFMKIATDETPYNFTIKGDAEDAKKYVHRMRVELSRMREELKSRGRVPKSFKMLLLKIHQMQDGTCLVTLGKKSPPELFPALEAVLVHLDDGETLI